MNVWRSLDGWLDRRQALGNSRTGLVPTMGALHAGHASLVERCRRENEIVVVTIFVNPSQFNDPRDLERYPRTVEEDLLLLKEMGADEVILPGDRDLYPDGYCFRIENDESARLMEGARRPGHLQGVMTVVLKLLNIARADRAYFGEKDFQQLRLVTEMARDFFVPTRIVGCPTVREASGLAMSSRNALLSPDARQKAAELYRILRGAPSTEQARVSLESAGFKVDYVEEHWGRRLAAVYLDGVRLIDNLPCS
ncbi:MAG: pantoate--beta-alanine ligase [Acidobacteriota bacterium]|nr:pantoate--beta-alanine ligase [Acidobacteriota bacterium]